MNTELMNDVQKFIQDGIPSESISNPDIVRE